MYKLTKSQIYSALKGLMDEGMAMVYSDGSIEVKFKFTTGSWIMIRRDESMDCGYFQGVYFKRLGFLPKRCINCWKIILRMRYKDTCYKVANWVRKNTDWPGKCGYDFRHYRDERYSVYIYSISLEEATQRLGRLERELKVVKELHYWIQNKCTEFNFAEQKYGVLFEEEPENEELVEGIVNYTKYEPDIEVLNDIAMEEIEGLDKLRVERKFNENRPWESKK